MVRFDIMLHWWPRTQASGLGIGLVTGFAPTLGLELPYAVKVVGFSLGVILVVWPILQTGYERALKTIKRDQVPALMAVLVALVIAVGSLIGWYTHRQSFVPRGSGQIAQIMPAKPSTLPAQSVDQISEAETARRNAILAQLSAEYRKTEAGCVHPFGQNYANNWANRRLKEMGETWQLPVTTIQVDVVNDNYVYASCSSINVKANDAEVTGNHQFGSRNEINVDADKAKVHDNSQNGK
jgi:hypothetical protein